MIKAMMKATNRSESTETIFPPQTYATSFLSFIKEKKKTKSNASDDLTSDQEKTTEQEPSEKLSLLKIFKTNGERSLDLSELWRSSSNKKSSNSAKTSLSKRWRTAKIAANRNANHVLCTANHNESSRKDNGAVHEQDMSMLKFLAINALDLTAPASDVLLKSRSDQWFQLSGHPDSLAPAGPGTVWKKKAGGSENMEKEVYEALSADPVIRDCIPKYYREVDYRGEKFIELQDLLYSFKDPNVMDIKMGTRTFLESEVSKTQAREDLYKKMIAVDPSAPSEDEHANKAVTKLRYMQFREQQSSSSTLGFRLEAMKMRGVDPVTDLKRVKCRDDVLLTMSLFLGGREKTRKQFVQRLKDIRSRFEQCEYFKRHEIIGSSIFMMYDDHKVGVWIIDFAKTQVVPDGVTLTHREAWRQGNHEEGFLFGIDQLITVLEDLKPQPSPQFCNGWLRTLKLSEPVKT